MSKVVYIDRIEQLWAHVEEKDIRLSGAVSAHVAAHEADLDSNPLMDYGIRGPPTFLKAQYDAMAGIAPPM